MVGIVPARERIEDALPAPTALSVPRGKAKELAPFWNVSVVLAPVSVRAGSPVLLTDNVNVREPEATVVGLRLLTT